MNKEDLIKNYLSTKQRIEKIESIHVEDFQNFEEVSQFNANQEVLDILDNIEYSLLLNIERALEKTYQNNYGYCDKCKKKISKKRIKALPFTNTCISCAI